MSARAEMIELPHDNDLKCMVDGSGPPLLFLQGMELYPGEWTKAFELLAEDFTVYVPEHPGFGDRESNEELRTMSDFALYYLDVLESIETSSIHLVGSSLGGWLATKIGIFAGNHPAVGSLTLLSPVGTYLENRGTPDLFTLAPEELVDHLVHQPDVKNDWMEAVSGSGERRNKLDRNLIQVANYGWETYFQDDQIPRWGHRISVPTQVLWGDQDKLFPIRYGQKFKEFLPDARFEVVEEAGHIIYMDQPERTVQIMKSQLVEGVS